MMRSFFGELAGTFVLASMVLFSVGGMLPWWLSWIPTPLVAAVTLGVLVYGIGVLGKLSDAHFNPAITFGAFVIRKKGLGEMIDYFIAQLIGAVGAKSFFGSGAPVVFDLRAISMGGTMEAFGAFIFALGVGIAVYGLVPKKLSGAVVGLALLVGILAAAHVSHGVLNPAVAAGIGLLNLDYIIGPMLGAALGMFAISRLSGARSK